MNFTIKLAMILALAGLGFVPASSAQAADDILLKSQSNGLCLDGYKRGRDIKAARCRTPFKAQRWSIDPESGQIKHARRELCLAVSNSNRANGARVVLWPCSHNTNQRWTINSNGYIQSALNGKCLDVSKHNTSAKRANVHMWECHGKINQKWERVVIKRTFKSKRSKNFLIKRNN